MNIPIHCPKCKNILITIYKPYSLKREYLSKRCDKFIDHYVSFVTGTNHSKVEYFCIRFKYNPPITAMWNFVNNEITVHGGEQPGYVLIPYFEPDIENYDKLINKIKMCLIFN